MPDGMVLERTKYQKLFGIDQNQTRICFLGQKDPLTGKFGLGVHNDAGQRLTEKEMPPNEHVQRTKCVLTEYQY